MIVEGWDGYIRYNSSDSFRHEVKSKCLKQADIDGDILLSIFIPTYKRKNYLRQAIDSAINQQDPGIKYEIVVVNNDPETDLSDIINDYSNIDNISFYVNEENIQWIGNWNRGLLLSRGKYIAYLHDDDLFLPNYVHEMGKILQDPKYSDVGALTIKLSVLEIKKMHDDDNEKNFKYFVKKFLKKCVYGAVKILTSFRYLYRRDIVELKPELSLLTMTCIYSPCGACFNREVLINDGGWGEEGSPAADWYTWVRFNQNHKVFKVHKKLALYRWEVNGALRITKITWACMAIGILCKKWQSEKLNEIIAKNKEYFVTMSLRSGMAKRDIDLDELARYFDMNIKLKFPTKWQCRWWELRNFIIMRIFNIDD